MASNYTLEVTPEAREDVLLAVEYYVAQESKLGSEFFKETQKVFEGISQKPKMFQVVHKKTAVRRVKLGRFPFLVFYQLKEKRKEVVVLAVVHEKRDPSVWKDRL